VAGTPEEDHDQALNQGAIGREPELHGQGGQVRGLQEMLVIEAAGGAHQRTEDSLGTEVGAPVKLPSALGYYGNTAGTFVSIAGTSQGFVAVYNGASASNVASLLATFLSNSAPVDAGTVPVGATRAFPGGYAYGGNWSARGSSDGVGAGFALLYPDGSVSFIYFNASGDIGTSPQAVLQQTGTASGGDEVQMTNFGGSFVVSLYSSGEHLTRMVASSCQ